MLMKRLQAIAIAIMLSILCGANAEGSNDPVTLSSDSSSVLTIAGESLSSSMNPAFTVEHPEVTVQFQWGEEYTVNQLLLDLTSKQATADIYVLSISSGLLNALCEKGFCMDLSTSKIITDFSTTLYPQVRSHVYNREKCIGVPYALFSNQSFGFNTKLGKTLNIDAPQTYNDLIELFAAWPDICENTNAEYPFYLSTGTFTGTMSRLLRYGVDAYIAEQPDNSYISFDTEEFHSFISILDQSREKLAFLTDEHSGWKSDNPDDSLIIESYPLLVTQSDENVDLDNIKPLILSIAENENACIPTDMTVFTVNTSSEHKDIAIQYLECLVEHYPSYQQMLVCNGEKKPVEEDNYQENLAYYAELQDDLKTRLGNADTQEARQSLHEQLAETDACIQENENLRWYISQNAIDHYTVIAPYLKMMPRVSFAYYFSLPNARKLLLEFIGGKISGDTFIQQFDQIQRIINLE